MSDDPDGQDRRLELTCKELEERLRIQTEALQRAKQELEEQARLRQADRLTSVGTLANGVAHEINNPLTYVSGNLEYIHWRLSELLRTYADPRIADLIEVVDEARHGADRVRDIVRDLKAFSGADEEETPAPIALSYALDIALSMCGNDIRQRARLVKHFHATPMVVARPKRLAEAFLSLLVNAVQSLPDREVEQNEVRITTYTDEQGNAVVIIRDTGCGIPKKDLGHIFDPFFTTKPIGEGTGLGLSVCHGVIKAIGGRITIESEVGEGSAFQIVLPPAATPPGPGDVNRSSPPPRSTP